MFLSDNELELADENNNDSITDTKKIKVVEKRPSKWLPCERKNLEVLKEKNRKSEDKRNEWNL